MDRDISMYMHHLDKKGVHEYLAAVGRQYDSLDAENQSLREQIASFNEADEIKKLDKKIISSSGKRLNGTIPALRAVSKHISMKITSLWRSIWVILSFRAMQTPRLYLRSDASSVRVLTICSKKSAG